MMRILFVSLALILTHGDTQVPAEAPPSVPAVRVNQVGYQPGTGLALAVGEPSGETAVVRDVHTGREIARVPIGASQHDPQSGDTVRAVPFPQLGQPGKYVVEVPGLGRSDPFAIARDVFRRPLYLATRSFYGLRCGTAVDLGPEFPAYRHAACHLQDGTFHSSSGKTGRRPATKGWHDAGDYGKYIVNSGISTGQLLWAYEWYPELWKGIRLDIPESGNATPDLLDETRWNLDWMLAMQDEDGGVWHKLTSERFGSFTMPEDDDAGTRYVIGTGEPSFKGTCATADFAAVMAIAARVYKPFDGSFADRALAAARQAYAWTRANADVPFRNPQGVSTGAYGDRDCRDERLWAAAELVRTTGESPFDAAVRELAPAFEVSASAPQEWPNVANMGLWTYALSTHAGADARLRKKIVQGTVAAASTVAARTRAAAWRHALLDSNFIWGSNGVAANYGVLLLAADRLAPDPAFKAAAADHAHYLLGRNTFGLSFLTGVGSRPFRHPHHRPSGADANDLPWPGLLSGGPNARGGDPALDKVPAQPPARRYVDDQTSYASNENAINWNAALVLLLSGLND